MRTRLFACPAILFVAICLPHLAAQDPESDSEVAAGIAAVESAVTALATRTDVDDATRAAVRASLDSALADWQRCGRLRTDLRTGQREIAGAADEIEALRQAPAPRSMSPAWNDQTLLSPLEAFEDAAEAAVNEASNQDRISQLALRAVEDRRESVLAQLDSLRTRIAGIESGTDATPTPAAPSPLVVEARGVGRTAHLAMLHAEADLLEHWRTTDTERLTLYAARSKAARDRLEQQRAELAALTAAVEVRKRDVASSAVDTARGIAEQTPAPLQDHARRNLALAETGANLATWLATSKRDQQHRDEQATKAKDAFNAAQRRLALAGLTEAVGVELRGLRDQLPNLESLRKALRDRRGELVRVQLGRMDYESELRGLDEAGQQARLTLIDDRSEPYDAELTGLLGELSNLFTARRPLLQALIDDGLRLESALVVLDITEQQLEQHTHQYRAFINQNILWIRSALPIWEGTLEPAKEAVAWFANPALWRDVLQVLWAELLSAPIVHLVAFIALMAMLLTRRRTILRLEAIARTDQPQRDLLQAAVATLWLAMPVPLVVGFPAWRLAVGGGDLAILAGLEKVAVLALFIAWTRQMTRANGLAERQFGWSPNITRLLRRHLLWAGPVILVCTFGIECLEAHEQLAWRNSMGRGLLLIELIVIAAYLHVMLSPGRRSIGTAAAQAVGWNRGLPRALYLLGVGLPIGLFLLSLNGYAYTATILVDRLIDSLWVGLAIAMLHSAAHRWIGGSDSEITEAAAGETASTTTTTTSGPDDDPEADAAEAAAKLAAQHASQLLRLVSLVFIVLGGYWIWVDVLPALGVLEQIELWTQRVDLDEMIAGPDGIERLQTVSRLVPITLAGMLGVVIYLAVSWLAARNLAGVLELTVYRHVPLDTGARFAITTLLRYAIVLAGVGVAMGRIGISWSSVQWLAAAITVGLGFGLQEIFANFVSGIILLFERPIRIGDLVTVGSVDGRITQIRMRATVVTDFDRRELIVPNKEFVTGQVVNWTLSDPTTRMVIQVGIAYGSDVEKAKLLLLRVARSCRLVLRRPRAQVVFRRFGESALELELRVFIGDRDHWPAVNTELHDGIDREFRNAGIEIPFPQRDLHIRTAPPNTKLTEAAHGD